MIVELTMRVFAPVGTDTIRRIDDGQREVLIRHGEHELHAIAVMYFTYRIHIQDGWLILMLQNTWLLLISKIITAIVLYSGIMWISGARIMQESIQFLRGKANI